jgi:hypothetical protein
MTRFVEINWIWKKLIVCYIPLQIINYQFRLFLVHGYKETKININRNYTYLIILVWNSCPLNLQAHGVWMHKKLVYIF